MRAPRVAAAAAALLMVGVLTGCAATVSLQPAADATSPVCADIIVNLPPAVGTAEKRQTDAQGTAAWGDPESVVLRCGVAPPGPSTADCFTFDHVDWLRVDARVDGRVQEVLTSFGRDPATQILVDPRGPSIYDVVSAVSTAVADAGPADRHCATASSPSPNPQPDASPSPTPSPG